MADIYVGDDGKLHKIQGGADSVLPFNKESCYISPTGGNIPTYASIYLGRVGNIIGGYRVKDGICYVKLTATSIGNGVIGNRVIFENMPTPKNGEVSLENFIINTSKQLLSKKDITKYTIFDIDLNYETTYADMPYVVE